MQVAQIHAPTPLSQLDRIRQALLHEIEAGVLTPGQALDEKALAERFGVSRTPVREALLTLAAQHLVTIQPRSGMYVHSPEPSELVSMLEALAEWEAVVARLSTWRMDHTQRENLQMLCGMTDEAANQGDRLAFEKSNQQFHEALYEGCGNSIVVDQVRQLRLRLSAFRRRVRDQPGRLQSSAADHRAIVEGLLVNNPERAAHAMREHISAKGRAFADLISELRSP